jgi:hypothetical protein
MLVDRVEGQHIVANNLGGTGRVTIPCTIGCCIVEIKLLELIVRMPRCWSGRLETAEEVRMMDTGMLWLPPSWKRAILCQALLGARPFDD